jgi:hypothetical protein
VNLDFGTQPVIYTIRRIADGRGYQGQALA